MELGEITNPIPTVVQGGCPAVLELLLSKMLPSTITAVRDRLEMRRQHFMSPGSNDRAQLERAEGAEAERIAAPYCRVASAQDAKQTRRIVRIAPNAAAAARAGQLAPTWAGRF